MRFTLEKAVHGSKATVDTAWAVYSNGRVALRLLDVEDGAPVCTVTVNVPELVLAENEVIIKDYEANEGVLDDLLANRLVAPPHRRVQISDWVNAPVCFLTTEALAEIAEAFETDDDGLKTVEAWVTSRVDGSRVKAQHVACACGHDAFHIYFVKDHQHIQCTRCEVTFCGAGKHCGVGT